MTLKEANELFRRFSRELGIPLETVEAIWAPWTTGPVWYAAWSCVEGKLCAGLRDWFLDAGVEHVRFDDFPHKLSTEGAEDTLWSTMISLR